MAAMAFVWPREAPPGLTKHMARDYYKAEQSRLVILSDEPPRLHSVVLQFFRPLADQLIKTYGERKIPYPPVTFKDGIKFVMKQKHLANPETIKKFRLGDPVPQPGSVVFWEKPDLPPAGGRTSRSVSTRSKVEEQIQDKHAGSRKHGQRSNSGSRRRSRSRQRSSSMVSSTSKRPLVPPSTKDPEPERTVSTGQIHVTIRQEVPEIADPTLNRTSLRPGPKYGSSGIYKTVWDRLGAANRPIEGYPSPYTNPYYDAYGFVEYHERKRLTPDDSDQWSVQAKDIYQKPQDEHHIKVKRRKSDKPATITSGALEKQQAAAGADPPAFVEVDIEEAPTDQALDRELDDLNEMPSNGKPPDWVISKQRMARQPEPQPHPSTLPGPQARPDNKPPLPHEDPGHKCRPLVQYWSYYEDVMASEVKGILSFRALGKDKTLKRPSLLTVNQIQEGIQFRDVFGDPDKMTMMWPTSSWRRIKSRLDDLGFFEEIQKWGMVSIGVVPTPKEILTTKGIPGSMQQYLSDAMVLGTMQGHCLAIPVLLDCREHHDKKDPPADDAPPCTHHVRVHGTQVPLPIRELLLDKKIHVIGTQFAGAGGLTKRLRLAGVELTSTVDLALLVPIFFYQWGTPVKDMRFDQDFLYQATNGPERTAATQLNFRHKRSLWTEHHYKYLAEVGTVPCHILLRAGILAAEVERLGFEAAIFPIIRNLAMFLLGRESPAHEEATESLRRPWGDWMDTGSTPPWFGSPDPGSTTGPEGPSVMLLARRLREDPFLVNPSLMDLPGKYNGGWELQAKIQLQTDRAKVALETLAIARETCCACSKCGSGAHASNACTAGQDRLRCLYPLCQDQVPHATTVCRTLHHQDPTCGYKFGHTKEDHQKFSIPVLDAFYILYSGFGIKSALPHLTKTAEDIEPLPHHAAYALWPTMDPMMKAKYFH